MNGVLAIVNNIAGDCVDKTAASIQIAQLLINSERTLTEDLKMKVAGPSQSGTRGHQM